MTDRIDERDDTTRYKFHASLTRRCQTSTAAAQVVVRGVRLWTVETSADVRPTLFDMSFDEAVAALTSLRGTDVEPDGFFVCCGPSDGTRWLVNGQLWEHGQRLWRVDLRGECPARSFEQLLGCFGWPEVSLAFELVQEGVTVDEQDFYRWAGAGA